MSTGGKVIGGIAITGLVIAGGYYILKGAKAKAPSKEIVTLSVNEVAVSVNSDVRFKVSTIPALPNADVNLYNGINKTLIGTVKTDSNGIAQYTFKINEPGEYDIYAEVVSNGKTYDSNLVIIKATGKYSVPPPTTETITLTSDTDVKVIGHSITFTAQLNPAMPDVPVVFRNLNTGYVVTANTDENGTAVVTNNYLTPNYPMEYSIDAIANINNAKVTSNNVDIRVEEIPSPTPQPQPLPVTQPPISTPHTPIQPIGVPTPVTTPVEVKGKVPVPTPIKPIGVPTPIRPYKEPVPKKPYSYLNF